MHKRFITSLVIAVVLLAAISTIALAGSRPQPAALLDKGQQVVTMTPGYGMLSGTPMPGANGMAMGDSNCPMMGGASGMTGMASMGSMASGSGMTGMSGTSGTSGMGSMSGMSGTGTMSMAGMDDTQVILSDPSTWLNNPWTLLGWLFVLAAFLAILVGIVLGVLWIVRHATTTRPA